MTKPTPPLIESLAERERFYRAQAEKAAAKARRAQREGKRASAEAHLKASLVYSDRADEFLLERAKRDPGEAAEGRKELPIILDFSRLSQVEACATYRQIMTHDRPFILFDAIVEEAAIELASSVLDCGCRGPREAAARELLDLLMSRPPKPVEAPAEPATPNSSAPDNSSVEPEPVTEPAADHPAPMSEPSPETTPAPPETVAAPVPYESLTKMALPARITRADRIARATAALSRVR